MMMMNIILTENGMKIENVIYIMNEMMNFILKKDMVITIIRSNNFMIIIITMLHELS
jgi:hypothetical protein